MSPTAICEIRRWVSGYSGVVRQLRPGETPVEYVRRLAAEKSAAALEVVARPFQGRERGAESPALRDVIILGADTTVVVDGDVLGKPQDDEEAAAMLRRLSGRAHEVLTGISLRDSASEVGKVETTSVSFRALSDGDVASYVSSGEGLQRPG